MGYPSLQKPTEWKKKILCQPLRQARGQIAG
jgi:hypothetical protein